MLRFILRFFRPWGDGDGPFDCQRCGRFPCVCNPGM